ncbi:MAG: transglycosylase SLT domain-containing protein [Methylacidiphilales bacterium]|nr:transglycosylase SLT domain-containing protein [Candidatus Methylacidiphilales bacterium]
MRRCVTIALVVVSNVLFMGNLYAVQSLPVTNSIQPAVNFWTRVFSEITTQQGFLHDKNNHSIVYSTLSLPPGSSREKKKYITAKIKELSEKIERLAQNGKPKDELDKKILEMVGSDSQSLEQATNAIRFQLGQADRFRTGLRRSGAWINEIEKIFIQKNLPQELIALPFLESGYNPVAKSHVHALGLWQFMRSTATRYLVVNRYIDERLDPILASEAAANLLSYNYSILKSWPLAITAYNHGLQGIVRAVKATGSEDLDEIIGSYQGKRFGFASKNFYAELLAVAYLYRNHTKYFPQVELEQPVKRNKLSVSYYISASDVIRAWGISTQAFAILNPALSKTLISGSKRIPPSTTLFVPDHYPVSTYLAKLDSIPADKKYSAQVISSEHVVESGDTIIGIATLYHVSVEEVLLANNLEYRSRIRIGQRIALPTNANIKLALTASKAIKTPTKEPSVVIPSVKNKVEPQDTVGSKLALIDQYAQRTQIPYARISRLRSIVVPILYPQDEELAELLQNNSGSLIGDFNDYRVKNGTVFIAVGETLGHYAEWLVEDIQELRKINNLTKKSVLRVGKKINLRFNQVSLEEFEQKRIEFHRVIQQSYFDKYLVRSVIQYTVKRNETILGIANRHNDLPLWLLKQYNPNLPSAINSGMIISIPIIEAKKI